MYVMEVGDLVSLKLNGVGFMVGDAQLCNLGAEELAPGERRGSGGLKAPEDYAFRICPRLTYRVKQEAVLSKGRQRRPGSVIESAIDEDDDSDDDTNDAFTKARIEHEEEQNSAMMERVKGSSLSTPLMYGDTIQLQNYRSGEFVGLCKSPGKVWGEWPSFASPLS